MKTLHQPLSVMLAVAAAATLSGCDLFDKSASGTVRGRVVDANGQPLSGARVSLDKVGGRTTLTNIRGEFRLAGASEGDHLVLAYSVATHSAGAANAEIEDDGVVDVGDVIVQDCGELLAGNGGAGAPESEGGDDGVSNDDPSAIPCQYEPPPPPDEHVSFDALEAEYAAGFVDPWGVFGYGDDASAGAGFDFWISADLTAGGSFSDHVINDYANGVVEAHVGLYTFDGEWGHYYVLREGDVTVTVSDDGDGDPSTLQFSFSGSNLVFDYAGWEGIDPSYTASVGSATAEGEAWQFIPPDPPTEDITLPTFIADWKYISICPQCSIDGSDAIYVYAYDGTNGADLSLMAPVSALALGGTTTLTASWESEIYGWASVYTEAGAWGYELVGVTVTAGETLASGETFALSLTDGTFDYVDAYGGGVIVEGEEDGSNGGAPAEPPPSEFQLFLGSADLTAVVDEYFCGDPGQTDPAEPGAGDGHGNAPSPTL